MTPPERAVVRVSVLALMVWQLIQGWRSGASQFELSYWLVTYEHGFVRRGLGGEVLRLLPGPVTPGLVLGAAVTVSVVSAAAVVAVVIALLRREGEPALWLALLVAASPFTVEAAINKHRPDQLGLVVLCALALGGGRRWVNVVTSLLLALLVLVHEGALVSYGLFALPLLVRFRDLGSWVRAGAWFAPSFLTTALVLVSGRAEVAQVEQLLNSPGTVAVLERPSDTDYSVLPYLSDSLADSVAVVAAFPVEKATLMVLWGALLAVVHAVWLGRSGVRIRSTWLPWTPALAALVFLHVTAVDWQRWIAAAFTALLVVVASLLPPAVESLPRPGERRRGSPSLTGIMLGLAGYLASRPPAGSVGWRDGWQGFLGYWTWPW